MKVLCKNSLEHTAITELLEKLETTVHSKGPGGTVLVLPPNLSYCLGEVLWAYRTGTLTVELEN